MYYGGPTRRGTLLVADRNPRFVERTEEILRGAGHRVVGVVHGDAAREALRAGSLDAERSSDRADDSALWRPLLHFAQRAVLHDACAQPLHR